MSDELQVTQQTYYEGAVAINDVIQRAYAEFAEGNQKAYTINRIRENKVQGKVQDAIGVVCFIGGIICMFASSAGLGLGLMLLGVIVAVVWHFGLTTLADKRAKPYYQKGYEIIEENVDVLSALPSEYWFPMATEYIVRMFATDRADNMREVLALTDTYLHRCVMEESANATLNSYADMSQQLSKLQSTASSSATASWITAVNTYIGTL